ncbi:sensor domain-containing diguanylate cyclase [Rhodococcus sp. SRB_17]|nr:sensor domain-containing diguanylate cyclase [Rhodococcus sp. SRB_17]
MRGAAVKPPDLAPSSDGAGAWTLPGALALKLAVLVALLVVLSGTLAGWLVDRASDQEAVQRLVDQQGDEVELVARLLASKIEQSQKVLRTVASGITTDMLESPSSLEWVLQQGLPAVQFFDSMQVARKDGELRLNLQHGRLEGVANLDPAERDYLRRTLVGGKPMVSELVGGGTSEARVMFTMPLHAADGAVTGALAGALRLQSQGLLPAYIAQPQRSDSRLVVFTRDGTILSHSDPERVMGNVSDEPGLAAVYAQWLAQARAVPGPGSTTVLPGHIVSMAGMPLPQWMVARVSDTPQVLQPLQGAQQRAWGLAAAGIALSAALAVALLWWLLLPLERLRDRAALLLHDDAAADLPWPASPGEVDALVQVLQALQGQRAHQARLQQAVGGQFQAILDHASIGIVVTRQGRLQVLGRQVCHMLGYAQAELRGRPLRMLYLSDADYADTAARVRAGFAAHGAYAGDVRLRRKDGSAVWARVQGRSVRVEGLEGGNVWTLDDLTAAHEARQQNAWAATHDPLTQLANRLGCEQRLQLLLAERLDRAGQGSPPAAPDAAPCDGVFLHLDIDHFTVVNDVAGHGAGDDVLCHVAQLLQGQVRQSGWVARLGGDEFAVVLPGCTAAHGALVAEQLRAAVQAWEPVYQGRSFTLGVSVGMVVLDARAHGVAAVLHAADMACYDAKRAGRNQVVVHAAPGAPRTVDV